MATDPQSPVTLDQLIRVVVSHSPDGDALVHLRDAVLVGRLLDDQADQLIGHFVDEARQAGASWTAIGDNLGVSKQAAQQRFVLGDDDVARRLGVGRGRGHKAEQEPREGGGDERRRRTERQPAHYLAARALARAFGRTDLTLIDAFDGVLRTTGFSISLRRSMTLNH